MLSRFSRQLYGISPIAWNGRFQRATRAISRLLIVAVYPQKERDQGTTGHQQLEGSVRAYGAAADNDFGQ
jgi:hypothetical protein